MNLKIVFGLAIVAVLAAPVAAQMSPSTDKNTSGSNAADRPANTPKSETGAAGATAHGRFESYDRNKDGYISRDEARDASWSSRFSELDKDNDGRISRGEFDALKQ